MLPRYVRFWPSSSLVPGRCFDPAMRPFWLAHDLLIMSPIAIADATSLLVGLWILMGRRATSSVSL
jgi:hypothetical protein